MNIYRSSVWRILEMGKSWNREIGMDGQAENGVSESHLGQQSDYLS
jgi:hypothetical protein